MDSDELAQIAEPPVDGEAQLADLTALFVVANCRVCDRDLLTFPDEVGTDGLTECQEHSERYAITYEDDPDVPTWDELADRADALAEVEL